MVNVLFRIVKFYSQLKYALKRFKVLTGGVPPKNDPPA